MNKYIPYEKRSKKEKRRLDAAGRNTWGSLNPATRKPENSRAYNRRKAQSWKKEIPDSVLSFSGKFRINCPDLFKLMVSSRKGREHYD